MRLHRDHPYELAVALVVLTIAAFTIALALFSSDDISSPSPTTFHVGPSGDDVVITPRAIP